MVRSRFPLSITAALFSGAVIFLLGGGGNKQALPEIQAQINPAGMLMLISFAVVIISALCGRYLIESLIYGNVSAIVTGLAIGQIRLNELFRIPGIRGESTGIIQDGINSVAGATLKT